MMVRIHKNKLIMSCEHTQDGSKKLCYEGLVHITYQVVAKQLLTVLVYDIARQVKAAMIKSIHATGMRFAQHSWTPIDMHEKAKLT